MIRTAQERIEDIRAAIARAQQSVDLLESEDIAVVEAAWDSIIHQIEIIGEAVRNLPDELKKTNPAVPWAAVRATRNFVTHTYWGIDYDLILDVVETKLPELDSALDQIQHKDGD